MVIFKSLLPPITFPETDVYTFLVDRPVANPLKPVLVNGVTGEQILYRDFKSRIDHLAAGFQQQLGIREYDIVGIFSSNHIEFPLACFAALRLGATLTLANPTYTVDELNFQLTDSKPRYLFTLPELLETAVKAAAGTKVEKIFVLGSEAVGEVRSLRELEKAGKVEKLPKLAIKDAKTRTAFLCYSSGTTGTRAI